MTLSVLMSVYINDDAEYFSRAIQSIWMDQDLKPDEIILIIDGPIKDNLKAKIDFWKNFIGDKFKIVTQNINKGLASSLNIGINLCSGEFVARMDADDISFPDRFKKQLEFLKNHDIDILGGQIVEFGRDIDDIISIRKVPTSHDDIVKFMKYRSPFSHPTIIFRRNIFVELEGYDPNIFPEDYDFYVRAYLKGLKLANLDDNLLWFRLGEDANKAIKRRWGTDYAKNELKLYQKFLNIGFYNFTTFLKVIFIKIPIRLIPFRFFKFLYFKAFR